MHHFIPETPNTPGVLLCSTSINTAWTYFRNCVWNPNACVLRHIWLFATPWTVPARLLCTLNHPGKNTGVGSLSLFRGSSWPRPWMLHCRRIFTIWATGKHSSAQESYKNGSRVGSLSLLIPCQWLGEWKFRILYPSPFLPSRVLPSLWNTEILPRRKLSDDRSSCFHCCFHGTSRVWRSGLAGSRHSNLCWVSGWVNVWIKPK